MILLVASISSWQFKLSGTVYLIIMRCLVLLKLLKYHEPSWPKCIKFGKITKSGLKSNKQRNYKEKCIWMPNLGQKVDLCEIFWHFWWDNWKYLNNENYCIMGNMPQNVFFLDSLQVKWLLSYHGNRKRMFGMKWKKFSNHFRKGLADLKSTNCIQKYQFCEMFLCFEHF